MIQIEKNNIVEIFQLLFQENLFPLLSEENQNLGREILTEFLGYDPGKQENLGLRFTIDEHLSIVQESLNLHNSTSDFWKLVTKITCIILSLERNPLLAQDIEVIKSEHGR